MSAKLKTVLPGPLRATEMEYGQIGRIDDADVAPPYQGSLVMKSGDGLISLDNPGDTWYDSDDVRVDVFPKGTEVTLTAE